MGTETKIVESSPPQDPTRPNIPVPRIASGGLVMPDGKIFEYSPKATPLAGGETLSRLSAEFATRIGNFEKFFDLTNAGQLLNRLLTLANSRAFLDQALRAVAEDTSFKNGIVKLFEGQHTTWHSMKSFLSWASIYIDHVTSTPIPENLEHVAEGQASLGALQEVALNQRDLYQGCKRGVLVGEIVDGGVVAAGVKLTVFVNNQVVSPRMVSGESSTITDGDNVYYNGFPGDRAGFPTLLIPEGSRITLQFENTTQQPLSVVPTINGIPVTIDHLSFAVDDFRRSAFPIKDIDPHSYVLNPGEVINIDHFHCDHTAILKEGVQIGSSAFLNQIEHGIDLVKLSAHAKTVFDRTLTPGEMKILAEADDGFRERIRLESAVAFTREFLQALAKPKMTEIFVREPIIADGIRSSELSNPLVGSIGMSVVRLERPPVKAEHVYSSPFDRSRSSHMLGDYVPKSMGSAGLASVGGGGDHSADYISSSSLSRMDMVHRYMGYAPINLMSTKTPK